LFNEQLLYRKFCIYIYDNCLTSISKTQCLIIDILNNTLTTFINMIILINETCFIINTNKANNFLKN